MSQQLLCLLNDIKSYLTNNIQQKGVFNLLARLDSYIQKISPSTLPSSSHTQMTDDFQILSHSQYQQPQLLQLQQVELIDIFVMDYSFTQGRYIIKTILDQACRYGENQQTMDGHRYAIMSLTIGSVKSHCTLKQKTNSMTQLHHLISNIPTVSPTLILPSYLNTKPKYTYIHQSKECILYQNAYYLVDRYYCVVTNYYASYSVADLIKEIRRKVFISRMLDTEDPNNVDYQRLCNTFDKTCGDLKSIANDYRLEMNQIQVSNVVEREIVFQSFEVHRTKTCRLIMYIIFSILNQFKVVLVGCKEKRNVLSEIILSLQSALSPLKYLYPIALCTLTQDHCQLLQSPVPLLIGIWGNQKKIGKFIKYVQKEYSLNTYENQQKIPLTVIDIQKMATVGYCRLNVQDCFIVQKMQKYLWKYGKGENFCKKISNLLTMLLQQMQSNKQYNEWMEGLRKKLKKSQMYFMYMDK